MESKSSVKLTHWCSIARNPLVCLDSVRNLHQKLSLCHLVRMSELKIIGWLKAECENAFEVAPQGLFKPKN